MFEKIRTKLLPGAYQIRHWVGRYSNMLHHMHPAATEFGAHFIKGLDSHDFRILFHSYTFHIFRLFHVHKLTRIRSPPYVTRHHSGRGQDIKLPKPSLWWTRNNKPDTYPTKSFKDRRTTSATYMTETWHKFISSLKSGKRPKSFTNKKGVIWGNYRFLRNQNKEA